MDSFIGPTPHRPLAQSDSSAIRRLKVYPGPFDKQPRCELEHISLDGDPEEEGAYTALSYTWGNINETCNIQLDGVEFPVTENLHFFLCHIQTILLAVASALPLALRGSKPSAVIIRVAVLKKLLEQKDFPQDFPSPSSKTALNQLVKRCLHDILGDQTEHSLGQHGSPESDTDPTETFFPFWIDALCINQRDTRERSSQVLQMKDIYSRASNVLIWLEHFSQPPSSLQSTMGLIHDLRERHLADRVDLNALDVFDSAYIEQRRSALRGVTRILSTRWLSRAWIVQEVLNATSGATVLIRFWPVSWSLLAGPLISTCQRMLETQLHQTPLELGLFNQYRSKIDMLQSLSALYKLTRDDMRGGQSAVDNSKIATQLVSIMQLVKGQLKATDPHDLVYAFLSILGVDTLPSELRPNYEAPIAEVYHQYEVYMIKHTRCFKVTHCRRRWLQDVPTWVPDWRHSPQTWLQGSWQEQGDRHDIKPNLVEISEDGACLTIQGQIIGEVVSILKFDWLFPFLEARSLNDPLEEGVDMKVVAGIEGLIKLRRECLEQVQKMVPSMSESSFQQVWDSYWPSPDYVPGSSGFIHNSDGSDSTASNLLVFRLISRPAVSQAFVRVLDTELQSISECGGIGIMNDGHLVTSATGSRSMGVGDVVCLLKGASELSVHGPEGSSYTVVGSVHQTSLSVQVVKQGAYTMENLVLI